MNIGRWLAHTVSAVLAVALAACASGDAKKGPLYPSPTANAALHGVVTYSHRIALTPDAVVKVWLQDISVPGRPVPLVLDEVEIRSPGQVPIAFTLRYDTAAIDPTHVYTVLARIYEGDRTRFINVNPFAVLTHGGCVDACQVVLFPMF